MPSKQSNWPIYRDIIHFLLNSQSVSGTTHSGRHKRFENMWLEWYAQLKGRKHSEIELISSKEVAL